MDAIQGAKRISLKELSKSENKKKPKNYAPLPKEIKPLNISDLISRNGLDLWHIKSEMWNELANPFRLDEDISKFSKKNQIRWDDINSIYIKNYRTQEKHDQLRKSFFYAKLYHLSAKEEFRTTPKLGDTSMIYALIFNVTYFLGKIDGLLSRERELRLRHDRASKGGTDKNAKREKIKARLLYILSKPQKGKWRDITHAAGILKEEIKILAEQFEINVIADDPETFIINEIADNKEIHNAFLENKSKK